ncbi:MAG: NADH-quinone oxidoreductase subunit J [Bacillota bacterium]|nr:NADH-quinone oxidoreductase subunit J [Bacillota bacterium]
MDVLFFWLLTAVIIGSALAVVLMKNIVHSALLMIVTFIGIAGLYITLNAEFLGLVQILVYVGAVSIILIFGIMLTRRGDMKGSNPFNRYKIGAGAVSLGLFYLIGQNIYKTNWSISQVPVQEGYTEAIPQLVLVDLLVPFQLAGLLLLVAMVGAIVLAKGVKKS